jgi:hypothetical protein
MNAIYLSLRVFYPGQAGFSYRVRVGLNATGLTSLAGFIPGVSPGVQHIWLVGSGQD